MTNKTLSEQICEVCGIEPIYHFYDESVDPILDEYLTKQEILKQYVSEQTPFEDYKKYEIYPDFENNNNNFMKLLEIVSKKASVSFCHNGIYYGCSIHYFFKDIFEAVEGTLQHNFLNTLLVQDLRNPCKPKLLEQIKEAIRQADWEM